MSIYNPPKSSSQTPWLSDINGGNFKLSSVKAITIDGTAATDSTLKVGSLEFQPYTLNNSWFGENVYYDGGTFRRRATGSCGLFYFAGPEGQFRFYGSDLAGTDPGYLPQFKVNADGTVAMGGSVGNLPGDYSGASFVADGSVITANKNITITGVAGDTATGMLFFNGGDPLGQGFGQTPGVAWILGYNDSDNRQLWMGAPEDLGDNSTTFFRYISHSAATCDAVSGDGAQVRPIHLVPFADPGYGTGAVLINDNLNGDDGTQAPLQVHDNSNGDCVSLNGGYYGSGISLKGSWIGTTNLDCSFVNAGGQDFVIGPNSSNYSAKFRIPSVGIPATFKDWAGSSGIITEWLDPYDQQVAYIDTVGNISLLSNSIYTSQPGGTVGNQLFLTTNATNAEPLVIWNTDGYQASLEWRGGTQGYPNYTYQWLMGADLNVAQENNLFWYDNCGSGLMLFMGGHGSTYAGKVGIKTSTPTKTFDVNGDFHATGADIGTTGGTVIVGSTGGMVGFFDGGGATKRSAYTQTYSTASRTVPAATASNPPAGGTGTAAGGYDTAINRNLMITSLTNCIADVAALKQVVNSIIDDMQAFTLCS